MGPSGGQGGDYTQQLAQTGLKEQLNALRLEQAQLEELGQQLQAAQPGVFDLLGISPGGAGFRTNALLDSMLSGKAPDYGPAPAAVADPGSQEDFFTVRKGNKVWRNRVPTGRTVKSGQGQGNPEVRAPGSVEIAQFNAKKNAFTRYQDQKAAYDKLTTQGASARETAAATIQANLLKRLQTASAGPNKADAATTTQLQELRQKATAGPLTAEEAATIKALEAAQAKLAAGFATGKEQRTYDNILMRKEAASAGKLPDDLNAALAQQRDAERNRMFQLQGPGWETSSAGLAYNKWNNETTSAISRADLGSLIDYANAMQNARQGSLLNYQNLLSAKEGQQQSRAMFSTDVLNSMQGGADAQTMNLANLFQGLQSGQLLQSSNQANAMLGAQTLPYQNSYLGLANAFGGMSQVAGNLQMATQRQQGPSLFSQIGAPLAQVGGLALGGFLASDRRLKTAMKRLGVMVAGLPVWSFRYLWDAPDISRTGFMADEVERLYPKHVHHDANGFAFVDYHGVLTQPRS